MHDFMITNQKKNTGRDRNILSLLGGRKRKQSPAKEQAAYSVNDSSSPAVMIAQPLSAPCQLIPITKSISPQLTDGGSDVWAK